MSKIMNIIKLLGVVLLLCGGIYFFYDYRQKEEQKEKEKQELYKKKKEKEEKKKLSNRLSYANKIFKYQCEKIAVLENIEIDSVALFLKGYFIVFEMLKFKENSFQIIGFEKEDKHKNISYYYDFIHYLESKYQYPKKTYNR